ncbi:MAG: hypothetical protein AAB399_01690 [Patescibacteria group bacterium]
MNTNIKFFDKFEDKIRGFLSHYPILYGIIGGLGTVLAWRGIWHTADFFSARYIQDGGENILSTINYPAFWDGFISLVVGVAILLATGLFVASFIGDHIIISGIRHEKKVTEKTEEEVTEEAGSLSLIHKELHKISDRLESIEKKVNKG